MTYCFDTSALYGVKKTFFKIILCFVDINICKNIENDSISLQLENKKREILRLFEMTCYFKH